MRNIVENLRSKPMHVRRQILFATTLLLTGVVVFFWAVTLKYRFGGEKTQAIKEDVKPFSLLKNNFSKVFDEAKDGFKGFSSNPDNPEQNAASAGLVNEETQGVESPTEESETADSTNNEDSVPSSY